MKLIYSTSRMKIEFHDFFLSENSQILAYVAEIFITKPFFSFFFRARVDVHRKDSVGSVEKAITIYGQPENCSNACLQILKVMQEEARNTDKSDDIPLKILGM